MSETIRLTPRLRAAADWVPQNAVLCDVGTDHAHLPAALVLEGRISRAIASDIRPGPLERARRTVQAFGLEGQIETRLCPGLEKIAPGEADNVTICGMGGEMIMGILAAAPWTREGVRLILQPQRSQPELRRWLREHGYRIVSERVVAEGPRWYTLLLAEGGADSLPVEEIQDLAGHPAVWVREGSRPEYLKALREKQQRLLAALGKSAQAEEQRIRNMEREILLLGQWEDRLRRGEWPEWQR